jgi:pyruvate/2-oxoglutarate dehydrogenase complex dihydrolipoamide acyltransferase (E2) component
MWAMYRNRRSSLSSPIHIVIPKLGEVMESGVVSRWLINDTDRVSKGIPLFEIETDKVTAVVECIGDGYIVREVEEGDEVPVGHVVARLYSSADAARSAMRSL